LIAFFLIANKYIKKALSSLIHHEGTSYINYILNENVKNTIYIHILQTAIGKKLYHTEICSFVQALSLCVSDLTTLTHNQCLISLH